MQFAADPVVHWADQDCWLARELERRSLVFHGLTVARSQVPYGQERCPVGKGQFQTSDCTNQLTETGIFCRRYFDINDSTVNEYFLTKF